MNKEGSSAGAPADGYDGYYQARLWNSLPEVYREMDSLDDDTPGPLRELLNRIGVQVAMVRRSIDGLWADQFIETCADWVIPYIGTLVAAGQVPGLDPRGQRLDVANTIHWRRRKGTLPTAGAVARDITGWDTSVAEGWRCLARTWHSLDPGPALPLSALLPAPTDPGTRTPQGGFADLRSAPAVLLAGGPFDQAFHHADVRRSSGAVGQFGAEKLIVYCWRLLSLEVTGATPVPVAGIPGEYVFDPTGREIPLFLPGAGTGAIGGTGATGDTAASAGTTSPWRLPGPLTSAVDRIMMSMGIPTAYRVDGAPAAVTPEIGRFRLCAPTGQPVAAHSPPGHVPPAHSKPGHVPSRQPSQRESESGRPDPGQDLTVSYRYGLAGPIGAGTGILTGAMPLRGAGEKLVTGGTGLEDTLAGARPGDTVTIADSRTYTAVTDVNCGPANTTVRARPGERPLIRLPEDDRPGERPQWVFHGGEGARLVLNGLFVSGGDIVLSGPFEHVKIVGCTFDPGTRDPGRASDEAAVQPRDGQPRDGQPRDGQPRDGGRRRRTARGGIREPAVTVGKSVDGRRLLPTRLWIEPAPRPDGQPPARPDVVRCLEIDRSIIGPVRTRNGGLAQRVVITDSILQGFRTSAEATLTAADLFDPAGLYDQLSPGRATPGQPRAQANPLSALIWRSAASDIPPAVRRRLLGAQEPPPSARQALAAALNVVIGRALYRPDRWSGVPLSPRTQHLLGQPEVSRPWLNRPWLNRPWLNRFLLEDAYPLALAPAACAVAEATVQLNRVTVLGRVTAHRLYATDSILHGFTVADDRQDGCFRYSAATTGSSLPAQYAAAWLRDGAALFTSTAFGHPGYGQLLDTADQAIVGRLAGASLLAGSSAGGSLGAFPAQAGPARERALRVKYNEYLPLGLVPAIVHVT